jgi:hypothetical protein
LSRSARRRSSGRNAIRAQFGTGLRAFGGVRRRRNELEYPLYPTEKATADEAAEALETADEIIGAVARLLSNLSFF